MKIKQKDEKSISSPCKYAGQSGTKDGHNFFDKPELQTVFY